MLAPWSTRLPRPSRPGSRSWRSCGRRCSNAARSLLTRWSHPRACRSRACARAVSRRSRRWSAPCAIRIARRSRRSSWSARSRAASRAGSASSRSWARCSAHSSSWARRSRAPRWRPPRRCWERPAESWSASAPRPQPSWTRRIAHPCGVAPRLPTACARPPACWRASRSISTACSTRSAVRRRRVSPATGPRWPYASPTGA